MNTSDLDQFSKQLLRMAKEQIPRERKKLLKKEAEKLKKRTLNKAQGIKDKKSGNCYKGIKISSVYSNGGCDSIDVYVDSEEAYLVEHGYRQMAEDGSEKNFVEGCNIFEKAKNEFESEFESDCEEFMSDTIIGGIVK